MFFSDVRPALDALISRLTDFGDKDMVDLLKAYKLGKSHECSCSGDKDVLVDVAQQVRDEAERIAKQPRSSPSRCRWMNILVDFGGITLSLLYPIYGQFNY